MKSLTAALCCLLMVGCSKQEASQSGTQGASAHKTSIPAPAPKAATAEEWKAALLSTYEESQVKDKGEGVTEFRAKFKLPEGGPKNGVFGQRDAFRKLRFYIPGLPIHIMTGVQAYISIPDNSRPHLFLQPYYWGHGWIFMEKISILVDGDLVFERTCKPDRDTEGVGVREQCDILLDKSEITALRKITKDSKVAVRLTGSKGYAAVKKDGYDPLKAFVKDLQYGIAIYDLVDAAVKEKLPPPASTEPAPAPRSAAG